MHPPAPAPPPSLYFDYRVFAPWRPRQPGPQPRAQVVIAGAGISGMVTALVLAQHGVHSVVLERARHIAPGSRAIVFTRRSLEILQQVGVADRMLAHGLPWQCGNSYYRGQHVFRMHVPHEADDRYGPLLNLQQQYLEQYLIDACTASPHIELRWGNQLTAVAQTADTATLTIDTDAGPYQLQTDWLVAADGGRSGLRTQLGLHMEGASYEGFFVIADIQVDLPLPTERLAFFDPPWNPGNTLLMHRQPHHMWRVDYQLPAGESPEQALSPAALQTRIDTQLALMGYAGVAWKLDWCSVYSARNLTLPNYVHGRTVFVGDAAHLLPIFGVRGVNTAFQDAQALGWQLALVAQGVADAQLLANYSRERVGAAREIIDEAGKSTRFMVPPSAGFRLLRDAVLSLSLTQPFVRPLYHWRTARPHAYTHSALHSPCDDNAHFVAGPAHGAPPLNARLGDHHFLLDHLGQHFTLLLFTDADTVPPDVQALVHAAQAAGVPLRVLAINPQPHTVAGAAHTLHDSGLRAHQRYGVTQPGSAYLLRPDQHIAARWLQLDAPRLHATLRHLLPRPMALVTPA